MSLRIFQTFAINYFLRTLHLSGRIKFHERLHKIQARSLDAPSPFALSAPKYERYASKEPQKTDQYSKYTRLRRNTKYPLLKHFQDEIKSILIKNCSMKIKQHYLLHPISECFFRINSIPCYTSINPSIMEKFRPYVCLANPWSWKFWNLQIPDTRKIPFHELKVILNYYPKTMFPKEPNLTC